MRSLPKTLLILLIAALAGVGVYFGKDYLGQKQLTDESTWTTVNESQFSITVPSCMKKGTMLTSMNSDTQHICFYTSQFAGFDVNYYQFSSEEKEMAAGLTAKDYEDFLGLGTRKINDQEIIFTAREDKNYIFAEYKRHAINHVASTDDVWYMESMFPTDDGYYLVNTYCAMEKKAEVRDLMLKWLDSFRVK